ncbi:hypothetical protein BGX20_007804 [Mortierella sp. AD010]|nr:hypothetical protein BGX20_007804 [Mortierella sp. AD010]
MAEDNPTFTHAEIAQEFQRPRSTITALLRDKYKLKQEALRTTDLSVERRRIAAWSEFNASDGWLSGFKNRHGLRGRNIREQIQRSQKTLSALLVRYVLCDVYYASEAELLYHMLPDETFTQRDLKSVNVDLITVLLTANTTVTEKLTPFIIGTAEAPEYVTCIFMTFNVAY